MSYVTRLIRKGLPFSRFGHALKILNHLGFRRERVTESKMGMYWSVLLLLDETGSGVLVSMARVILSVVSLRVSVNVVSAASSGCVFSLVSDANCVTSDSSSSVSVSGV